MFANELTIIYTYICESGHCVTITYFSGIQAVHGNNLMTRLCVCPVLTSSGGRVKQVAR